MLQAIVEDLEYVPRLIAALVLSAVIGWERERKQRSAGLRTHMLVGVSACAFMLVAELLVDHFPGASDAVRFDPIRIVQATVAGVSFLGAGSIVVTKGDRVRGLTTGASLLATSAVGTIAALQRYTLAIVLTLTAVTATMFFLTLERD